MLTLLHLYDQRNTEVHRYAPSFLNADKKEAACIIGYGMVIATGHKDLSNLWVTPLGTLCWVLIRLLSMLTLLHLYYRHNTAVHRYAPSFLITDTQEVACIIGYGMVLAARYKVLNTLWVTHMGTLCWVPIRLLSMLTL